LHEGAFPLYDPTPASTLDDELERFLGLGGEAARPVVFTPGSGNVQAARYFERALAATRRLGRRAIFLTPHRAQVPARLPAEVLWHPYVPLRRLLPRVAALVHHGGIGTTAEALRAGTPQLVVPLAFDQFDNGARVEALGAGRMLTGWRTRTRPLARALDTLLRSPEIHADCARTAALVEADEHIDPAARIETLLWGQVGVRSSLSIPPGVSTKKT
jgi:rhamnosyltransferase subunit B